MKHLSKSILPILLILCLMLSGCHMDLPLPTLPENLSVTEPSTEAPATEPPATQPPTTVLVEITPVETEPPVTETPVTEPTEPAPLEVELPEPEDEDFVRVRDYIPDIVAELRYATEDNFTGQVIYEFDELWLRYGTVKKLICVQETLGEKGLGLKVWDGFRPVVAQFALWKVCPNPAYVANPNGGYSSHSRGNTIDLTVANADGTELVMPTGFDDFSKKANRDYADVSNEAAQNARLLEGVMKDYGFSSIYSEWWHFVDTKSYSPEKTFQPVAATLYEATAPVALLDTRGEAFSYIPREETFPVIAKDGDALLVEYRSVLGWIHSDQIQPVA
jgi:D-alanyl-D-alanine dipeptidase